MGQKINPNIFRLGVSKTWKTAYYENSIKELPLHIYKDNDLIQFIDRYLNNFGIISHNCKYQFNHSTFIVYVSYFVPPLFKVNNNKDFLINKLIILNKQSNVKKNISKNNFYSKFKNYSTISNNSLNFKRLKLNKVELYKKKSLFKNVINNQNHLINFKDNLFLSNLKQIIKLFLNKNDKFLLCFNCINKDFSYLKNVSKNQIKVFKRFNRLPYFKENIELFLYIITNKKTSNLFAKFLAQQFQKTKRQNFFLKFVRQVFTSLINSSFSKYKGIKIVVNGRLNGVPRAKHKIVSIGDVPVTSISDKIDYSQTFCHNSNGSLGIKIWMSEK